MIKVASMKLGPTGDCMFCDQSRVHNKKLIGEIKELEANAEKYCRKFHVSTNKQGALNKRIEELEALVEKSDKIIELFTRDYVHCPFNNIIYRTIKEYRALRNPK